MKCRHQFGINTPHDCADLIAVWRFVLFVNQRGCALILKLF